MGMFHINCPNCYESPCVCNKDIVTVYGNRPGDGRSDAILEELKKISRLLEEKFIGKEE